MPVDAFPSRKQSDVLITLPEHAHVRPLAYERWVSSIIGWLVAGLGGLLMVSALANGQELLSSMLLLAAGGWMGVSPWGRFVEADGHGVIFRNRLRVRTYPWSAVEALEVRGTRGNWRQRAVVLRLADGRRQVLRATGAVGPIGTPLAEQQATTLTRLRAGENSDAD